jgi:hypothetical protein
MGHLIMPTKNRWEEVAAAVRERREQERFVAYYRELVKEELMKPRKETN